VGLSQTEAASKEMDVIVGRADFSEVARAHIAGEPTGFLALLCDRGTARVLGCQVLGEGATDLVHLGQAAIATGATADFFIEQIFNFPTMTEAYRIAAFDVLKQRSMPQAAHLELAHATGWRGGPRGARRAGRAERGASGSPGYRLRIKISPNSLHLTSVAPSICRAK